MQDISSVVTQIQSEYRKTSTVKTLLVDALLVYSLLTAVVQFVYVVFVGTFPFNSFLSGFICHLTLFALGVSLRLSTGILAEAHCPVYTSKAFQVEKWAPPTPPNM